MCAQCGKETLGCGDGSPLTKRFPTSYQHENFHHSSSAPLLKHGDSLARAQFRNSGVDGGGTRIDEIVDGIYRISTWQEPYGITFNQFLIADERPALIHTGMHHLYESIRRAIGEVLDPIKLSCIIQLHREGDENGGMD